MKVVLSMLLVALVLTAIPLVLTNAAAVIGPTVQLSGALQSGR